MLHSSHFDGITHSHAPHPPSLPPTLARTRTPHARTHAPTYPPTPKHTHAHTLTHTHTHSHSHTHTHTHTHTQSTHLLISPNFGRHLCHAAGNLQTPFASVAKAKRFNHRHKQSLSVAVTDKPRVALRWTAPGGSSLTGRGTQNCLRGKGCCSNRHNNNEARGTKLHACRSLHFASQRVGGAPVRHIKGNAYLYPCLP